MAEIVTNNIIRSKKYTQN